MDREHFVVGRMVQGENPDWRPLARVVSYELLCEFMWMFEVATRGGGRLHAYKHAVTRRYLHLDSRARAFAYVGEDRYRPISLAAALELVLRPWWERLGASAEEVIAAWTAIERARRSEDSGRGEPPGR